MIASKYAVLVERADGSDDCVEFVVESDAHDYFNRAIDSDDCANVTLLTEWEGLDGWYSDADDSCWIVATLPATATR